MILSENNLPALHAEAASARLEEVNVGNTITGLHQTGVLYCLSGEADVVMDGRIRHICPQTLMIVYPYGRVGVLGYSPDWSILLWLGDMTSFYPALEHISPDFRMKVREKCSILLNEEESEDILLWWHVLFKGQTRMPGSLAEAGKQTHSPAVQAAQKTQDRYVLAAFFSEVVLLILNHLPSDNTAGNGDSSTLNTFLLSLIRNCPRERTVSFYAAEQHLHPYYFSAVIRQQSGKTVMQWIEGVTINMAKHYLADESLSIKEIAERLNFPDQSTFGRYFRKHVGTSPAQYRRAECPDRQDASGE